uniref:Uncharacterized protein n=1 Tax=Manihot esculenta TaxID=3983 RepID=A0A2C9U7X6_MANES
MFSTQKNKQHMQIQQITPTNNPADPESKVVPPWKSHQIHTNIKNKLKNRGTL